MVSFLLSEYCLIVTSGNDKTLCRHEGNINPVDDWSGDDVTVKMNGKTIDTISKGFTKFKHCIFHSNIDLVNDQIQIEKTNKDEVCITSLTIEFEEKTKQILVGKSNDKSSFWIGDDLCFDEFISTRQVIFKKVFFVQFFKITIQNGSAITSACTQFKPFSRSGQLLEFDLTVPLF